MAERAGEGITTGGGAVREVAAGLRDRGGFEIGAVQAAATHVDRFALPHGADVRDAQRSGDGGIDRRFDHGDVVPGDRREDASRSRLIGVTEANRERSEHSDVFRGQDADAVAGRCDDGPRADAALARGRRDDDDGTFGRSRRGGGRKRRSCEARKERREGHDGDACLGDHW